jgi:Pao retrotransposon peptidase.
VFCGVSKLSYAATAFLRCKDESRVSVQLLLAKSRIAPLKEATIPRLELLACCIGVRLIVHVKRGVGLESLEEHYWTDSLFAMYWITKDE